MEKYGVDGAVNEEFIEPEIEPFQSHGYLKSCLQDEQGRDQMVLHFSETVGVYWNKNLLIQNQSLNQEKGLLLNMLNFHQKGHIYFQFILKVFNHGVELISIVLKDFSINKLD